jgi:hypothetical protein
MDLPVMCQCLDLCPASCFLLTLGFILEEAIDFGNGSVEGHNGETMVGSVENQILAHDRKANETEITTGFGLRWADLEASQSRTKVSILVVNGGDSNMKKSRASNNICRR